MKLDLAGQGCTLVKKIQGGSLCQYQSESLENRTNRIYVYGEGMWDEKEGEQEGKKKKEIYFKALTHVIMETGQLKSIKQASASCLENPG